MLSNIKLSTVLFLDIETAPMVYNYNALDDNIKQLWDSKFRYQQSEGPEAQYQKAGIYAEFSKVICISVGFFNEALFLSALSTFLLLLLLSSLSPLNYCI